MRQYEESAVFFIVERYTTFQTLINCKSQKHKQKKVTFHSC
uniref:Uncharacterized protein n=1 Tax=Rhizophora mucronata TaxID=61149 RepID=A0A2P2QGY6_RHIMU